VPEVSRHMRWSTGRILLVVAVGALGVALLRSGRISQNLLISLAVMIPSVILHEVAHGFASTALGDPTAKRAGRLSLRPARHVDPLGTVILPALTLLAGVGYIGWAKPVPVDPSRLKNPRNDSVLVALAGPLTNVILVVVAFVGFRATHHPFALTPGVSERIFFYLGLTNVWLAGINLLPVPPLDGSALLERALPASAWPRYLRVRPYLFPVLLGIVIGSTLLHLGLLEHLNQWLFNWWVSLVA